MTIHQTHFATNTKMTEQLASAKRRRSRADRIAEKLEFRLIVALAFSICLVPMALRRMIDAGKARDKAARESVLAEARSAAYAVAGYAFHA